MKKILKCLTLLIVLCPVKLWAQQDPDITGVWNGQLTLIDSETVNLPYEIAVSEEKGKLFGYSRIVFHANGKDEAGVQDFTIEKKGYQYIMVDEGFIEHGFSINPSRRVKKTLIVTLTVTDKEMILEGTWSTNRTRIYRPYKGVVLLKRKLDFKKSELFKSLDTLKLVDKLSFKDRPEQEPLIAAAAPLPAEKKPEPVVEAEPELIIPSITKTTPAVLAVIKKPQPAAKVSPFSKQKKAQMDALAKITLKPPVVKPAPPPPKPEPPVVATAPPPKQEKKTAPPPAPPKPTPPPVATTAPAKKPDVAVAAPPKPTPPAVVVAPSKTQGAAEVDKRVTKSDQSYYFESDSLVLTLYDNGEVDGDTVTVLMNGGIIFSKTGLSTKANTKTVYITPDMDSVKLVMYAESLGEIPPNTGLLIVNDGDKRYDVRFSADLKTNAGILLRRRKEE